ncbi:MAG: hypothetical protein KME15_20570 [Drouetiella hepatica Uher 2000/2452]|uniref:Uncharacterized protein n=1 Tax=Drouetiella hepatica Uher 2000/2452 TaxID=904376 RepID=A0A951QEB3_9CYAN|nr:hypothetical protein [Drouetiella hepatica Uher 2000/2452]
MKNPLTSVERWWMIGADCGGMRSPLFDGCVGDATPDGERVLAFVLGQV